MALSVAKGSFQFPDSSANYSVTGIGFQPKAVLFWVTRQSAEGFAAPKAMSFGWAVSSTQRGCITLFSDDAVTVSTSNGNRISDARCISVISTATSSVTTTLDADFVSMDAGGFTIDPINVSVGALYIVHWLALGGADLTNAYAGNFNAPIVTGSTAFTGVGFQPDSMLVITNATGTIPRDDVAHKFSLGAASSAANQGVTFIEESNAIPTACNSIQKSGEIIHCLNLSGTDNTVAALESFDSDGFHLNFTTVQGTARGFLALCLKGASFRVGTETQKTSTGTKATTGVGFTPRGVFLFGSNRASTTSVDATLASLSVGATDGTTSGASWIGSTDNVSTTDENSATVTGVVLRHATNSATTDAEATLSSFDGDGFTLNWTTADATAREFLYWAFGDAPSVFVPPIPTLRTIATPLRW